MKQLFIVALLVAAAMGRDYEAMFRDFKAEHLKSYASAEEEERRFGFFVENMKRAEVLQAENPLATFGPNLFADMSAEEFKRTHLNGEAFYRKAKSMPRDEVKISRRAVLAARGGKIDWREKGAVTPVKDQGQCGSCWAFSVVGGIEGAWAASGHPLTALSEQELVSCDKVDSACNGGMMRETFKWLENKRKGKIVTEKDYPYKSGHGAVPACDANLDNMEVGATISGHKDIPEDEGAMAAWILEHGPISIGLDASSFMFYTSGILTDCISQRPNHGVVAVGYDDTNVPPYWIVKNSWGTGWGEKGYIRIAKGSNQCLIKGYSTGAIISLKKGGNIVQKHCGNSQCTTNCKNYTFPLNECLPLSGGGAAIVTCTEDLITMDQYQSEDCTGTPNKSTMPTKQCLHGGGGYFMNYCEAEARHLLRLPLY